MAEKTRYSDEELAEFKEIILKKIEMAKREYTQMMSVLTNKAGNDVTDLLQCAHDNKNSYATYSKLS